MNTIPPGGLQRERLELLMAYGLNSLSFHTTQPGLDYFDALPRGYVAYKDYGPCRFAITDPVCSAGDLGDMVDMFDKTHRRVTYFHITEKTAQALDDIGYYINEMGEEAILDIASYSWAGRSKMDIRHLHNMARKRGVEVREVYDDTRLYHDARDITSHWLGDVKKNANELWFITRRPMYEQSSMVRKFYALLNGTAVAFVYFDPIWAGQQIQGYCPSILRRRADAPKGALAWIIHEAMEKFRDENIHKLYLGLLPGYKIEDDRQARFRHSRFTMTLFRWLYGSSIANMFYGFKSLSFHKSRYRADMRKVYMATRSSLPLADLFCAGRMVGVLNQPLQPLQNLLRRLLPAGRMALPRR